MDILDTPRPIPTLTSPPALRQVHLALLHQPLQPQGVGQQDINLGEGSETAKGGGKAAAGWSGPWASRIAYLGFMTRRSERQQVVFPSDTKVLGVSDGRCSVPTALAPSGRRPTLQPGSARSSTTILGTR